MSNNLTTQLEVGIVNETLSLIRSIISTNTLNERARKELLIQYLPRIFPQEHHRSKLMSFAVGAESYVPTAPSQASESARGFIDTLNGKMILEFKRDLLNRKSLEEAQLELKRYVASLWTQGGTNSSFACISTDVINWRVYRPVPTITPTDNQYTADMVNLELVEQLSVNQANESNAQHLTIFLERILLDENLLTLTADNIQRDFGLNSNLFAVVYPQLLKIVQDSSHESEVKLALDLWKKQHDYNAISETTLNIELYTKQVYLLILSRLMVATSYQKTLNNNDQMIKSILNGEFFRNVAKINNLVDYDYYGWIANEQWINNFFPVARHLFHHLKMYDFATVTEENMIQLIYDEMLPDEQRGVLGQKSTPTHLANAVVEKMFENINDNFKYLDPACGCGNFIRAALTRTREYYNNREFTNEEKLVLITDAVTGIDIDPTAVILSKAVWAMTLADLIRESERPVDIPIYHADSLFIAKDETTADGDEVTGNPVISFDEVKIEIPNLLLSHSKEFDLFINWCNRKAHHISKIYEQSNQFTKLESNNSRSILPNILNDNFLNHLDGPDLELLVEATSNLVNEMARRIIEQQDGLWAFILRNSYRPSLIAGQFDVIATNPPWLTISNLPNVPYKEQLEKQARYFGIKPPGDSFLHSEISTTFALHNVKHFLKEDGKVAFVVSRSIADGDNHAPFRKFSFKEAVPFCIDEVWDLKEIENLFNLPSCVIFGKRSQVTNSIHNNIPARFYKEDMHHYEVGNLALCTLADKNAWLRVENSGYTVHGSNYYTPQFKQGADLMPRTALFIDLVSNNPASNMVHVQTSAIELANRDNKKLKGIVFEDFVNRKYLFSTVTSNTVLPFVILEDYLPKVLLPIEIVDNAPRMLTSEELIDLGHDSIASWFEKIDNYNVLTQSIYQKLNLRGKITQQSYINKEFLVHCGAGGSIPCAAIQRNHKDSPYPFIADQTTYVYGTDSEEEALYLIGMINSTYVNEIIRPFQARGLFGERHIHKLIYKVIPKFNQANPLHQQIVDLSRNLENNAKQLINLETTFHNFSRPIRNRRNSLRAALNVENITNLNSAVESALNE